MKQGSSHFLLDPQSEGHMKFTLSVSPFFCFLVCLELFSRTTQKFYGFLMELGCHQIYKVVQLDFLKKTLFGDFWAKRAQIEPNV